MFSAFYNDFEWVSHVKLFYLRRKTYSLLLGKFPKAMVFLNTQQLPAVIGWIRIFKNTDVLTIDKCRRNSVAAICNGYLKKRMHGLKKRMV